MIWKYACETAPYHLLAGPLVATGKVLSWFDAFSDSCRARRVRDAGMIER